LARLPLSRQLRTHFAKPERAAAYAAAGGEDYELLWAIPPGRQADFAAACRRAKERVTCIGRLRRGRGISWVWTSGEKVDVSPGFDHFRTHRPSARPDLTSPLGVPK